MAKVYLGNTQLYNHYFGSSYNGFEYRVIEPEAQSFFDSTGISDIQVQNVINTFVFNLKIDGIWDKMIQILPFVADTTASLETKLKYNLKDVNSYSASFPNGLGTTGLNGFQADNASSIYSDTNLSMVEVFQTGSGEAFEGIHFSVYTTTSSFNNETDFGAINVSGVPITQSFSILHTGRLEPTSGNNRKQIAFAGSYPIITDSPPQSGSFVGSLTGSNSYLRVNSTSIGSNLSTTYNQNLIPSASITVGGIKEVRGITNILSISNRPYQMVTIGKGLTENEMDTLSTHIQTFQESIDSILGTSRAV